MMGTASISRPGLSEVLPPLILGTGTFNHQYVSDPHSMPSYQIVKRALALGVNAFDTSPYYGPSETILGNALKILHTDTRFAARPLRREDYLIVTKAGRIAGNKFDYSPRWIRYSVLRSLERMHTKYLDVVYTHDVEFVSPREVLEAVTELRRLRDEGLIRYIGISGYPIDVLCDLADIIARKTGEPLDAVMSYGHFTVQNTTLASRGIDRLKRAGVEVVPSASMLGLGLLSSKGIDTGPMKSWHPAPPELKERMKDVVRQVQEVGGRMETVALSYALAEWNKVGKELGSRKHGMPQGISVMGVSTPDELEETVNLWRQAMSEKPRDKKRIDEVRSLVETQLWPILGEWKDYSWDSPGAEFKNERKPEEMGAIPQDAIAKKYHHQLRARL